MIFLKSKKVSQWLFLFWCLFFIIMSCGNIFAQSTQNDFPQEASFHAFFFEEITQEENASLLEKNENFSSYRILKDLIYGNFILKNGESVSVYHTGLIKEVTFFNDVSLDIMNQSGKKDFGMKVKGGESLNFYLDGSLDSFVTVTDSYEDGFYIPKETRISYWESGRLKSLKGKGLITKTVSETKVVFKLPLYVYENGIISYYILDKSSDSSFFPQIKRGYPVYFYFKGELAQFTTIKKTIPFDNKLGTIDPEINVAENSPIYLYPNGKMKKVTLGKNLIIKLGTLKAGSDIIYSYNKDGELTISSFTLVDDLTLGNSSMSVKIKGGKPLFLQDGQVARFNIAEDIEYGSGTILAGTEIILYPNGKMAKATLRKDDGEGFFKISGTRATYFHKNENPMYAYVENTTLPNIGTVFWGEIYIDENKSLTGFECQVDKAIYGQASGTKIVRIDSKDKERLDKKRLKIDNMYPDWSWDWEGYQLFPELAEKDCLISGNS